MTNHYENIFAIIDEDKVEDLVNYYERTLHDRKFISTWKNFYEAESEMMGYIGYYIDASDTLFKTVIGILQDYNNIRNEILGMADEDSGSVITLVVERIRNMAAEIDRIHEEVAWEYEDLKKVFMSIWKIYDDDLKVPELPLIPEPMVKKEE